MFCNLTPLEDILRDKTFIFLIGAGTEAEFFPCFTSTTKDGKTVYEGIKGMTFSNDLAKQLMILRKACEFKLMEENVKTSFGYACLAKLAQNNRIEGILSMNITSCLSQFEDLDNIASYIHGMHFEIYSSRS